ncbi:energy-coupling factor ABC transporter ATP-binding protein [Paracoccus sp. p4-l81]|uniref:energy-coupling factor ABC transporter ATP-binding protein n=1 Tax=unclassified Paracoccus (in: a-proteobacteria) TaxID=2688777 RepID=UPI0035BB0E69
MIRIDDVHLALGGRTVLDGIDLTLTEGRIGLIGANGSGKSTLARLLNGLILPDRGRVTVDGLDSRRDGRALRRQVGFVFQNPDNQIVMPTVAEDLAFGLTHLGLPRDQIAARTDEALRRHGLWDLRDHPAHQLSGGQKQLLAIAGVLAMQPARIVLDEPTTLLDLRNARDIARRLAALDQKLVVVTHDLDLLADFDRVVMIEAGRVAADGPPGPVLAEYAARMTG